MKWSLFFTLLISVPFSTFASNSYFEIDSVVSEELVAFNSYPLLDVSPSIDGTKSDITTIIGAIDDIVALGEKIYKIAEKGRAVVTLKYEPINVLPISDGEIVNPLDMENWSIPMSKKYRIKFINKLKMVVIDFIYSVNINYGGQFQGSGRYLSGVQIVPELVDVAWGFNFDASFGLISLVNHGTKENPIVGATLLLNYSINNLVSNIQNKVSFHVTGSGEIHKF